MSWLVTQINLLSLAELYRQTKMQSYCNVIKVHGYTTWFVIHGIRDISIGVYSMLFRAEVSK